MRWSKACKTGAYPQRYVPVLRNAAPAHQQPGRECGGQHENGAPYGDGRHGNSGLVHGFGVPCGARACRRRRRFSGARRQEARCDPVVADREISADIPPGLEVQADFYQVSVWHAL